MVTSYTLELQHLYKVNRHDEADRFRPWSKNHNRRLLWHGSRLTNWVGILSQVSAGVSCRLQRRIAQRFLVFVCGVRVGAVTVWPGPSHCPSRSARYRVHVWQGRIFR